MFTRTLVFTSLLAANAAAFAQDAVNSEGDQVVDTQVWLAPRPVPTPGDYTTRLAPSFIDVNSPPEGDIPRDLAFTPNGNSVAIVNHGTGLQPGTMTFYDVNTRTITDTVTVGLLPNHVAVSPNGQFAVCTNVFSHSVSIVDIATHTLLANVPITGTQPFRVAITPDSNLAVVAVTNDAVNSAFSVIDLQTRTEVRSFPAVSMGAMGSYFTPEVGISSALWTHFALSNDGTTIVLPARANAAVILYDVATGAVLANLPTAVAPTSIDISDDGTIAVIGHELNNRRISRVDIAARTLTQLTIADDIQNQTIRVTPDKTHAIAAISNNVAFYNLTTGATAATLFTGIVGEIEISHNGQYAFVSNANSSVIDIASRTIARVLPLAPCVEAACSPTQLRAVALNNRFREDIHLFNINGAAGFVEGLTLTGEPPEGDATRNLAISSDGLTLVAGNTTSRNATIINAESGAVLAYIDTGDRILDLAMTPNGAYALVCNTDDGTGTVSVVDIEGQERVAHLSVPTRPSKIRISPDGSTAYVLTVAGADAIHFINIAGAASTVTGSVLSGQTGNAQGYTYTEVSGIELSPDGSILAVCVSFDDFIRLIDTSTRAIIADVPVGDFPIRAAFNPAGNRLYVSNSFSDNISVIEVNGAASTTIATIPGVDFPLTLNVDPAGAFVYVGNQGSSPAVRVIDTATNSFVATVGLLGGNVRAAALDNGTLYAAGLNNTTGGRLYRIAAAGASSSLIDETPLSGSPSDMVFSSSQQTAFAAQPVPDGVDAVDAGPTCGTADFDGDGDTGTDADIEAFFACLGGNCCPTCGTADFDGDGDTGTDADIEAFFRVLGGGTC